MGKATPERKSITIWGRTFGPEVPYETISEWMQAQPEYPLLLKAIDIYASLNEQGQKWALQVLDVFASANGAGPNVTLLIPPPLPAVFDLPNTPASRIAISKLWRYRTKQHRG